jgi:hypothetical protein
VRVVQAHHLHHWAQGGPTTLSNLVLLCRRHHQAVPEEGYQVARGPAVGLGDSVGRLRARHDAEGRHLNAHTAHPGWLGERLDLGWAIDVLRPKANCAVARGGI